MLAREGYTVLEIGYNLPQYGQEDFYLRRAPFDLMYFKKAIEKLLDHPTVYGKKVAIVGHSKGAEFGVALASLMPELVELSVTSSQFMTNPAALPVTYQGRVFDAIPFNFHKLLTPEFNPKKDVLKIKNQCEVYSWKNEQLFSKNENGEWDFNKWILEDTKRDGFPTENANKIVHCQTTSDPLHSPSEDISKTVTSMQLEGVDADISYAKAGHLPLIPVCIFSLQISLFKNFFQKFRSNISFKTLLQNFLSKLSFTISFKNFFQNFFETFLSKI